MVCLNNLQKMDMYMFGCFEMDMNRGIKNYSTKKKCSIFVIKRPDMKDTATNIQFGVILNSTKNPTLRNTILRKLLFMWSFVS